MKSTESVKKPFATRGHLQLALVALLAVTCLASPLVAQAQKRTTAASSKARAVKQYSIEQFMNTVRVTGSAFAPDEKSILFSSNKTGIFNVYSVPVAGGAPQQLTKSEKESTYAVAYLPDGRILYTYDRGGNENSHLYVLGADGKEQDLTPGEKTKAQFLGWNQNRTAFYFSINERDPRYFDIYKMQVPDMKRTMLYQDDTGYDLGDISYDEKFLAFVKPNTTTDSDIYLYNAASKEMKHLTPHKGKDINYSPQSFDVKSRSLYYLTDEGGEFQYIARYNIETGKSETVEKAPWDVSYTYFSRTAEYRTADRC